MTKENDRKQGTPRRKSREFKEADPKPSGKPDKDNPVVPEWGRRRDSGGNEKKDK
jgi:hypothetical protein